ncbi:hypothetical protein DB345_20040 [Spartobacteria bacterium LR76]|nr:hypothetical protein DB345_20040 [Spartobacteria bacterium LR76]
MATEVPQRKFKTLFLCTANAERSILAEYLLRKEGGDRFEVYSGGTAPSGTVHPLAVEILRNDYHVDASDARSKSWEEFQGEEFDFVITLCDAAREQTPDWPGQPIIAHWSSRNPAETAGDAADVRHAFFEVAEEIHRRIQLFVALPIEKLDLLRLKAATHEIGTG